MSAHPAASPWLAHLATDRRGLPVPWVNLWGSEDSVALTVRHDGYVRGPAVFQDDGERDGAHALPDFTRQNMGRQREAMAAGRCQVCARAVPWSRRFLVLADLSVQWVDVPGLAGGAVATVTEPWLDDRCAQIAMRYCPALVRRTREEHLTLVPITSARQVTFVISTGWIEGELEEATRAAPPAMWIKLALLDSAAGALLVRR